MVVKQITYHRSICLFQIRLYKLNLWFNNGPSNKHKVLPHAEYALVSNQTALIDKKYSGLMLYTGQDLSIQ